MPSSYTIGDHFESFVKEQVEGGSYASASEVIRDGLRLLEEEQRRRQAVIDGLRGEIERGRRSGKPKPAAEVLDRLERKYTKWPKNARSECARTSLHKPKLTWRRSATTSRSTILDALSRSFARYGNTARRLLMDRITTWRVQTWAIRYGFAHTEIT
jgi:antitoxin ParD1/3/4